MKIILLLLGLLSVFPLRAQTVTEVKPEGGTLEKFALHSPAMKREIPVAVLLPPGYGPEAEALPVVYALHGMGGPYLSFMEMAPMRAFVAKHPMLIVSFQADVDSCYLDATHRPSSLFTTFLFEELMPEIARRYRCNGRQAVSGFSMGGYGAIHYLLERPQAFTSVSALSGAFELFEENTTNEEWRKRAADLLGPLPENAAAHAKARPAPVLASLVASGVKLPPLLLMCGSGDWLRDTNRRFLDFLHATNAAELEKHADELKACATVQERRTRVNEIQRSRLVDFEYRESPGGHDWHYWRDAFTTALEFHWRHFSKN